MNNKKDYLRQDNVITQKMREGKYDEINSVELEKWVHTHRSSNTKLLITAKFEIQKRQTNDSILAMQKSAKWTKWMAVATVVLAVVTFISTILNLLLK